MSSKMLRKALSRIDSMPERELKRLMALQVAETDMLESLLENGKVGHCVLSDQVIRYVNTPFCTLLPTNRRGSNRQGLRPEKSVTLWWSGGRQRQTACLTVAPLVLTGAASTRRKAACPAGAARCSLSKT